MNRDELIESIVSKVRERALAEIPKGATPAEVETESQRIFEKEKTMSVVTCPAKNTQSKLTSMAGNHVAVRVPDFQAAVKWYTEKLDFRVVHKWPYTDQKLAYVAPANDDNFTVELLADGEPKPIPKPVYSDLGDSLRLAGYHHFCLTVVNMEAVIEELRKRVVNIITGPFYLEAINRKLAFIADPFGNLIELTESVA